MARFIGGISKGIHAPRRARLIVGVAAVVLLLISSLAGVAQAQSEEPPGKVRGTWEVTLNIVDSVPFGDQTSEEAPEGPGPPVESVTFETSMESCGGNLCFTWQWNPEVSWNCDLAHSGRRFHGPCSFAGAGHAVPHPRPTSFRVTDSKRTVNGVMATAVAGTLDTYDWIVYDPESGELLGWRAINTELVAKRLDTPPAPTTTTTTIPPTTTTIPPTTTTTLLPTTTAQPPTTTVPATTTTSVVAVAPVSDPGGTDQSNGGDGTEPPGVSALVASVNPVGEVSTDPLVIATNLLLAALLVLLMPFPAELFNRTLDEHYDEVLARFGRRRSDVAKARRERVRASWWTLGGTIVAGSILGGLLDPGFGWNATTIGLVLGTLVAFVALTLVGTGTTALMLRRAQPGIGLSVRALPGALLVVAACVLVSRLIGFLPGYLYGLLAGVAVAALLSKRQEGRAAAVGAVLTAVAGLGAWLAWSATHASLGAAPSLGAVAGDAALATLFIAGLEGLVFALAPMRFLAGEKVFRWNRWVWSVLFGLGAFAVIHFLAHPGQGYGPVESATPFVVAGSLFAGFALLSVSFWAWFRFRKAPSGAVAAGEGTAVP
jgi:hypothetical protein